jgi:hypothetical protein
MPTPVPLAVKKRIKENTAKHKELSAYNPIKLERGNISNAIYRNDDFAESVLKYAKNEKGNHIRLSGWFKQYLRFLGDFRIATKGVSGCQQSGKSLGASLVLAYCAIELGLVMLYTYDSQGARDTQVKRNLQPILAHWETNKFPGKRGDLSDNLEIWESKSGGIVQFLYSSVNSSSKNVASRTGLASAGGKNVGYQADGLIDEERSQSPPGARDPFKRRTVESTLKPYAPHLILGTPGGGLGIEYELQKIEHHFAPYYDCPHCGAQKPLHPKGCMLKSSKKKVGEEETDAWFSESGKPLDWFHRDPMRPEASAFVACSECGEELPEEARVNATYRECKFDVGMNIVQYLERSLNDFLDNLPQGQPNDHISAALWISPLLRDGNPAPSIIREGNTSANTADWQQQNLGITSESGSSGITIEQIKKCIGLPCPSRIPDLRLAGLDQGRQEDWLWFVDVWLPDRWRVMTITEVLDRAIRRVIYGDAINRSSIYTLLDDYAPDFGLIDNEPDIPDAVIIAQNSIFELADQGGTKADIDKIRREAAGLSYDLWVIRQKDSQDRLANGFVMTASDGYPLYRLPQSWEKWLPLIGNEQSPITHLTAMSKDPETRKWNRPLNHVDDHFFAGMFIEAGLLAWLKIQMNQPSTEITAKAAGEREIRRKIRSIGYAT